MQAVPRPPIRARLHRGLVSTLRIVLSVIVLGTLILFLFLVSPYTSLREASRSTVGWPRC